MPPLPRVLDGISDVVHAYDWFVVDQWGVLHDGHQAHPGAVDALRRLTAVGPVALVSNTSRRTAAAEATLRQLGFGPELYTTCWTAGELAARWLEDHIARSARRVRVHSLFGPPGPESLLAGLPVDVVPQVEQADVVLTAGTFGHARSAFDPVLTTAAARALPLLCANPDVRSIQPDGSFLWCPGAFAERYAAMGGRVVHFGKPTPGIYTAARTAAGADGRGLAFGDSLQHDACGARAAGLAITLVTRGIHGPDLALGPGERPRPGAVAQLAREHGTSVDFVCTDFRW